MILLLGNCGFHWMAESLRKLTGGEVAIGGFTQVELVERLKPDLVYVDLFGFDTVAPYMIAAVSGQALPPVDLRMLRAVVRALEGSPVVYRGLRRPASGTFGLLERHVELDHALNELESVLAGQRVLDIQGMWARHGIPPDDLLGGVGHGEALRTDGDEASTREARWLFSLWAARKLPPIKCVVVDLDHTLIHGELSDDDFHRKNPAWLPLGATPDSSVLEGWWAMKRGLHEALRIVQQRGVVLALATRNAPELVHSRFRRRPSQADHAAGIYGRLYESLETEQRARAFEAHPRYLEATALDVESFVCVEAGFGAKSDMCKRIAARLGVGLNSLAFLDDSPIERGEVRANARGVHVLEMPVEEFRSELLHGPRFSLWDKSAVAGLREASYRSRELIAAAGDVESFLREMEIVVSVRRMEASDRPRVEELLGRTNQLNLTGERSIRDDDDIYVATCRDRIADHGLVSCAVFRGRQLHNWVCSCRVLPHRVAASLLFLFLEQRPASHVARVETGLNAATRGLIEEARSGLAPWVNVA